MVRMKEIEKKGAFFFFFFCLRLSFWQAASMVV